MRENANVLVILGMHRSGTSLTASWLEKCGLSLFDKMPGDVGNTKGHFEDSTIVKFHQALILRNYPKSKGWVVTNQDPGFFFNEAEESVARELYAERNNAAQLWGWKDPRTTLVMHEWKRLFGNIKVLCVWRPCLEVVESLTRRSRNSNHRGVMNINIQDSFRCWLVYNQALLDFVRRHPEDALLTNIKSIIRNDIGVFRVMRDKWHIPLTYADINSVYQDNMFNKQVVPSLGVRLAACFYPYSNIEKQLLAYSEILSS